MVVTRQKMWYAPVGVQQDVCLRHLVKYILDEDNNIDTEVPAHKPLSAKRQAKKRNSAVICGPDHTRTCPVHTARVMLFISSLV